MKPENRVEFRIAHQTIHFGVLEPGTFFRLHADGENVCVKGQAGVAVSLANGNTFQPDLGQEVFPLPPGSAVTVTVR